MKFPVIIGHIERFELEMSDVLGDEDPSAIIELDPSEYSLWQRYEKLRKEYRSLCYLKKAHHTNAELYKVAARIYALFVKHGFAKDNGPQEVDVIYQICMSRAVKRYRVRFGDGGLSFNPKDGAGDESFQWLKFYSNFDLCASVDIERRAGLLNNELAGMQAEFKKAFYSNGNT